MAGDHYLSDLTPHYVQNGLGPFEKDRSNGGSSARDGRILTLNGQRYDKGLGVYARSELRYDLRGACSSFTAKVGVDDEVNSRGSVTFQVWADGTKLFDSGRMRGNSPTQDVNVSVAGKHELSLVVTDAGDGNSSDSAAWADARVSCGTTPGARFLSDISWVKAVNGWGPVEKDRSNGERAANDGRVLTINGRTYSKGLGVHANSEIVYDLGGNCSLFTSDIGVDAESGRRGSIVFQVLADGVSLFRSGTMVGNTGPQSVSVNLTGRKQLTLKVTSGGDGIDSDKGDWANAQLACGTDETAPTITGVSPVLSTPAALSSVFSATFSEPMDTATIHNATFVLRKQGATTPLLGSISYDAATMRATLKPATQLDPGATYIVTIVGGGSGVKDLAGNALAENRTWTVATAAVAPPPEPVVPPQPPPAPEPDPKPGPEPEPPTTPSPEQKVIAPVFGRNQKNVVIRNAIITNPKGSCVDIEGAESVVIENSTIGPCSEAGIDLGLSKNITIKNVYIHDTIDNGMIIWSSDNVNITDNRIERVQTAISALDSTRVNISFNNFLNVRGPFPRGQFVQFERVKGAGNRIMCNVGENVTGQSNAEDAISLFDSNGVASDPIQVIGNKIKGGGPSDSGGGIMLGDDGGSYQTAKDNILVNPGQYGIAVSGGTNMEIVGNTVYGKRQSFTNVGLYVWDQYSSRCSGVRVEANIVNWTNSSGQANSFWNGNNCGTIAGLASNNLNAAIDESVFDQPIKACQR